MAALQIGPFSLRAGLPAPPAPTAYYPVNRSYLLSQISEPRFTPINHMPATVQRVPPGVRGYGVLIAIEAATGSYIFEPINPLISDDYGRPNKSVYPVSPDPGNVQRLRSMVVSDDAAAIHLLITDDRPGQPSSIVRIPHAELRSGVIIDEGRKQLLARPHVQHAIQLYNTYWSGSLRQPLPYQRPLTLKQMVQGRVTSSAFEEAAEQGRPINNRVDRDALRQHVMQQLQTVTRQEGESDAAFQQRLTAVGSQAAKNYARQLPSTEVALAPPATSYDSSQYYY